MGSGYPEEVPDQVWWTMVRLIFISFGEEQRKSLMKVNETKMFNHPGDNVVRKKKKKLM